MRSVTIPLNIDPRIPNVGQQLLDDLEGFGRGIDKHAKNLKQKMSGDAQYVVTIDYEPGTGKASIGDVYKKGEEQLRKLNKAQKKATEESKESLSSLRQQVNTWKQMRDGVAKYTDKIVKGKVVGRELNSVWVNHNKEVQAAEMKVARLNGNVMQMAKVKLPWINQIMSMGNALNQVTMIAQSVGMAIQAISAAISPLINRSRQIDSMKLSFEGFGMSAEQAVSILDRSKEIALRYGASLTGIEKGFKRITPAILASGGSLEETAMIMEALSARTATLGLNTEQTGRYIEAFAQVMGKGKLQSEELNQQFSELDGSLRSQIAGYLASEHGIHDLEKAMQQGKVTAALFREAFVAVSEEMRENLAGALDSIQSRIDDLNIQQVENIVNVLNTISMEGIAATFSGLGKSLQRLWVGFSQFFASLNSELPGLSTLFKISLDVIGTTLELVVNGFLVGVRFLLQGLENIFQFVLKIANKIANIPGIKQILGMASKLGKGFIESFREGTDMILNFNNAVETAGTKLEKVNGRIMVLKNKLKESPEDAAQIQKEMADLAEEAKKLQDQMQRDELKNGLAEANTAAKLLKAEIKETKQELADKKKVLDEEKAVMAAIKDAVKKRYAEEIEAAKALEETIKGLQKAEKERHKEAQQDIKTRYDAEKAQVKEIYDQRIAAIQAEIGMLQERTPAEQKLYELKKKELKTKLRSNDLSKKEKLEIEAQLERMGRQEQIAQKQKQIAAEKAAKAAEEKRIQDEKNAALNKENKLHESNKNKLDAKLDSAKSKTEELEKAEENYVKMIDESNKEVTFHIEKLSDIPGIIQKQIAKVQDAKYNYDLVNQSLDGQLSRLREIEATQKRINEQQAKMDKEKKESEEASKTESGNNAKPRTPRQRRASGGPVTGGTSYTVNELGQEGFLSASGKLSSINAPSWGKWTAPGAGTVIPAHIWSEMNASSASAAASGAAAAARGVNATGGMMRALGGLVGGSRDRITNNVTVQAVNTTKTASDMLVEMTKLRRRRYS